MTATDATGTSAEAIATFNVIEIPAAPVITSPGNGSTVTGAPGASYTTVTISGTATAVGSISLVWVYQADGTYLCRSFAVNGTWSCTTNLTTPGTYTAVAYWSGIDAGIGEPSNQVTFTYEVARAQAPTITTPVNGSTVTGAPGASYTTVTISGTAPAYPNLNVIRVYRADGTYLCLSFVSNGTWSCTTNIRDPGAYTVVAYWDAIDSGTGDPSNQVTFTYARARAQAPTITTPTTGSTITGGVGASSTDVTISGTAPAYANLNLIWVYEADGTYLCRSFVSNGTWSCTASIRDPRAYTVVAYWEGIDSGTGDPSNAVTFTYEIASPDPPVITTPATGTTITSAIGTSYTTVTVSGTATPSGTVDTVRVYRDDGTYVCTSLVTNGTWSCTTQVTDPGNYTLIAYWEDITSGIGDPSTSVTFTYALIPTDQPLITTPSAGAVVYNTTTPTIAGTATNGSTVTVYVDGTPIGTTVSTGGAWTFTPPTPLGEGSHSVYVTADAGSGPSDPSATITFAIDTTPPAAPSITAPARGALIGTATPVIRGTAELGNTVNVYVDGALYCTVNGGTSADPWTCEGAVLADGEHSVYAIAIDEYGRSSLATAAFTFTVDNTAPAAPAITAPVNGSVLTTHTPAISGTAEPGTTITVTGQVTATTSFALRATTTICTAQADSYGAWTCTPTAALANGIYTISATAEDAAGNTSSASNTVVFRIGPLTPIDDTKTPTSNASGSAPGAHTTITRSGDTFYPGYPGRYLAGTGAAGPMASLVLLAAATASLIGARSRRRGPLRKPQR